VLHTWGQKLDFLPHLHCIVTGGALSPDGKQWRSPKQRKFLFPVRALAALFRGKFLASLAQMLDAGELHLPDLELKTPANRTRWFLALQQALGPLCQTSLWRAEAGLKLPGQLHPPRRAE
jgi:Putative transposase